METKKSSEADLERRRPQAFLMGLVLALSVMAVALEYSIEPDDPLDDPALLEMLDQTAELSPMLRPENMLVVAPKAEPQPSVRLKVVDNDEQQTMEQLQEDQMEQLLESDATDDELPEADEPKEEPPVLSFRVVEDVPQFPGGPGEFMKWLTRHLKYPALAQENKVQGKVVAEFIVNTDGSVTDVRIVSSLSPLCDGEALRVLRMMPRWKAGVDQGKPCRTKVCIPIVFRL